MSGRPRGEAERLDRAFFVLLFLFLSASLAFAFRLDRHLSADGAAYFTSILDERGFMRVDWARGFAEDLTQAPLVLAVRAGVTHVPALSLTYALGIYLPYLLSVALALWAVRGENPAVLALPILVIACVDLPADAILAGEHHVMVLLAAPILLLILRRAPPTAADGALLALALLAFSRSYTAAILPALLFAALLAFRLRHDRADRRAVAIRVLALALSFATIVVSVTSALDPRDAVNAALFRGWLPMVVLFRETLLPAAFGVLFLLGLATGSRLWSLASIVPAAAFVTHLLGAKYGLTALESFAARTLSLTLLPALLLVGVAVKAADRALTRFRRVLLGAMVAALAAGSARQTAAWGRYRAEMEEILGTQRGYVPVEATTVDHDPARWAWTSPHLSAVWSYPHVRAIVENRASVDWQPFDPKSRLVLKRYVTFDPLFAAADPTARFGPGPREGGTGRP